METSTSQQQQLRKAAYKIVGRSTLKKTLPLVNRLMDLLVRGRFTSNKTERDIELAASGILATWLLVKGIRKRNYSLLRQGLIVGGALAAATVLLNKHQKQATLVATKK